MGKKIREMTSILLDRVANFDIHLFHRFFDFNGLYPSPPGPPILPSGYIMSIMKISDGSIDPDVLRSNGDLNPPETPDPTPDDVAEIFLKRAFCNIYQKVYHMMFLKFYSSSSANTHSDTESRYLVNR